MTSLINTEKKLKETSLYNKENLLIIPEFVFELSKSHLLKFPYMLILKKFEIYYNDKFELPYFLSVFDSIIDQIFPVHLNYYKFNNENYNHITPEKFKNSIKYIESYKKEIMSVISNNFNSEFYYNQDLNKSFDLLDESL